MNTIKNLIIKDILALKAYDKLIYTSLGMALVFTFLGFFDPAMSKVTYAGIALPVSVLGSLSSSILYEEEKANADSYMLTFPVTRKDVVLGKYLYNLTLIGLGIVAIAIIAAICIIFCPLSISNVILITILFGSATNLLFIIKTPLVYKYGTEKANNIFMIILFAILSLAPVILLTIKSIDPDYKNSVSILTGMLPYIPVVSIILLIIFNIISYKISYKIYMKKEF